ncbi:MAG: TraR/DksA C4-type zinc finger protein [Pseudomonadota bacterium]
MTDAERDEIAALIAARLAAAEAAEAAARAGGGAATVALDQQAVGRLSRMDALQGQAMARATATRRRAEIARLREAARRVSDPEFGECEDCGEPIGLPRLRAEPTLRLCRDCMGTR